MVASVAEKCSSKADEQNVPWLVGGAIKKATWKEDRSNVKVPSSAEHAKHTPQAELGWSQARAG